MKNKYAFVGAGCLLAATLSALATETTDPAWEAGADVVVAAGDVVTLTQATAALGSLTVNGTLTFASWDACVNATNVTIASGGLATSVGPFKDEADKTRVYFACTDLTVAKGGRIDVSAQGWACGDSTKNNGYGPGTFPTARTVNYAGGSHGGIGSFYAYNNRSFGNNPTAAELEALTYGSASAPETHGSGGYSTTGTGGAGGGVVRIAATGRVTVCGQILANGRDSYDGTKYNAGGAGGSIYVTCETFAGTNGLVRARGGNSNATWSRLYHGGGGGRVAITFDVAKQASLPVPPGMEYSADCGPMHPPDTLQFTQARIGSLYFSSDALIDRTGCALFGALDFANVTDTWTYQGDFRLTNGWATLARDSVAMRVTGDFVVTGPPPDRRRMTGTYTQSADTYGTRWDVGGTQLYFVTNTLPLLQGSVSAPRLTVDGDMTVSNYGIVQVWSAESVLYPTATEHALTNVGARVAVGGALALTSTGKLYCRCQPRMGAYPYISANSLAIDATSYVTADGEGYFGYDTKDTSASKPLPTVPLRVENLARWTTDGVNCGYGHGGKGGYGRAQTTPRPMIATYDDPTDPVLPGAGGVGFFNNWVGARGGGVVYLNVAQGAVVDGAISASGWGTSYCGGSAGGTIRVKCTTLSGSGTVSANGSDGHVFDGTNIGHTAGGGGGGMIWVKYDTTAQASVSCAVVFRATGGQATASCCNHYGLPGTIWFPDDRLVSGLTTWRHAGRIYAPDAVSSYAFDGDLTIENGFIDVPSGGDLTVNGDLTITGGTQTRYGVNLADGVLTCAGALRVTKARVTLEGGYAGERRRLAVGGRVTLDGADLTLDYNSEDVNAVLDFPRGLELTNSATFQVTSPRHPVAGEPGVVVTASEITVGKNCWIKPWSCATNGASALFKVLGTLTCAAGGGFDANGSGIQRLSVDGAFYGYDGESLDGRSLTGSDDYATMASAGHGGKGGHALAPGGKFKSVTYPKGRGQIYDDALRPVLSGLPGCGSRWGAPTMSGGGVVRIEAHKFYLNGGTLKADGDGYDGIYRAYAHRGGGSGGTVYVRADRFFGGGGTVSACGGVGSPFSGFNSSWTAASGGGGRIAMWTTKGDTNATLCASGGAVSGASSPPTTEQQGYAGEDGTAHWLYLRPATLVITVR